MRKPLVSDAMMQGRWIRQRGRIILLGVFPDSGDTPQVVSRPRMRLPPPLSIWEREVPPSSPRQQKPAPQTTLSIDRVQALIAGNNQSSVSLDLLLCQIWKESRFNPAAKSSTTTATGLMMVTVGAVADVNANTPIGVHFEHS